MSLRRQIKRSITLTILYYLVDDLRARYRLSRGKLVTRSGSRHGTLTLEESLQYIERVYRDYVDYGELKGFAGRVAEIGPGDNFGVALLMLGAGAKEVHTIDRFRPLRYDARQAGIYWALATRHGLGGLLVDDGVDAVEIRGLVANHGVAAEVFFRSSSLRFDYIVSRAVLEHLYDPLSALDDMAEALAPGGTLIHRIDFRDHGMFSGHHPLTFLTIRDALYRAMTRGSGRPNRFLLPVWRNWLHRSPLTGSLRVTRLVGVEGEMDPAEWDDIDPAARRTALAFVRAIRPRLVPSLTELSDKDLAVSGCVLVAKRPSGDVGVRGPAMAGCRPDEPSRPRPESTKRTRAGSRHLQQRQIARNVGRHHCAS